LSRPPANLAPRWRYGGGPYRLADANARYAVLEGNRPGGLGTELVVLDIATGAVVARADGYSGSPYQRVPEPTFAEPELIVAALKTTVFAGIDARTGTPRWTAGYPAYLSIAAGDAASHTVVLFHPGSGAPGDNLVAIDTRTGVTRWSDDVPSMMDSGPVLRDGRVFVLLHGPLLQARDAVTGAVLWSRPLTGSPYLPWLLDASRDHVAAVGPERTDVYDPATGSPLGTYAYASADSPRAAALFARTLVAQRDISGLSAMDPGTALPVWSRQQVLEQLTARSDAIYGCTPGHVLHALDPATGASSWSVGLAECQTGWPRYHRTFRVATDTSEGDIVLAETPHGEVQAYARAAAPAPVERAEVTGVVRFRARPLREIELEVGDTRVRTDAAGRFHATVEARALVSVRITAEAAQRATRLPCGRDAYVPVELTGAGHYHAAIEPDARPQGECGCGECD
jgi:outer membrane protein assembly factor BamB